MTDLANNNESQQIDAVYIPTVVDILTDEEDINDESNLLELKEPTDIVGTFQLYSEDKETPDQPRPLPITDEAEWDSSDDEPLEAKKRALVSANDRLASIVKWKKGQIEYTHTPTNNEFRFQGGTKKWAIGFTYLQKKARPVQTSLLTIRANNSAQQQASVKNRRLAMQMERRLSASAALKIKKKSIRQRLGVPNSLAGNVRDRLTLPSRGKGIRRGRGGRGMRGRNIRRSQSMQSLQGGNLRRSASMQSLNRGMPRRSRSRSRSRARDRARTPSRNRSNSINRQPQRSPSVGRQRRFSTGSFGTPATGLGRGGARGSTRVRNQRLRLKGNKFGKIQRGGGNSNRGGRGNFQRKGPGGRPQLSGGRRGRSRSNIRDRIARSNSGGNQTKVILPTKEELDRQLEQYMANTKSHLDKEIDTYMKESGVNDL